MNIEPTDEQKILIQEISYWFHNKTKPWYSYTGGPGTGKTTILQWVVEELNLQPLEIAVAAYVGKAVLMLIRKGLAASTIHSLIYQTYVEKLKPGPDDPLQRPKTKMKFRLKETLDARIRLIVIDEATMVNDKMRDELLSFGVPILFVGDTDQLPPIFGISSVMIKPDFRLTKIMRQAEGDPIIYLSQRILHDELLQLGEYGKSRVISNIDLGANLLTDYDIIICARNQTREMLNTQLRKIAYGYDNNKPHIGDKVICRQNNWDYCMDGIYLTNGLIGYITDIDSSKVYKGYDIINFRPDFMDTEFEEVSLDHEFIMMDIADRNDYGMSDFNKFEYGYAITAHLSQGSEYDRVLFIDEGFGSRDLVRKIRYTAVTRAKESVTIVRTVNKWEHTPLKWGRI